MIKSVIVDDDHKNISILKSLLGELNAGIAVDGEANSAAAAHRLIPEVKPELVFLDIEMPYGNGFDLLDKLMPVDFEVIFITAFDAYTLKAIRYSALDYLMKPVDIDELGIAVKKAAARIAMKSINTQLSNLLYNISKPGTGVTRIALPVKEGFEFININDITSCQSENNCTMVYTKAGARYVCSRSIKEYEDLLPTGCFFRVHHSWVVNVNYIRRFYKEGRGGYLELQDGTIIPVAYRRKDEFLGKFGVS